MLERVPGSHPGTLVAFLAALAGCSSTAPPIRREAPLVERLAREGVSDSNTRKILLVGSEGGYGAGFQVEITAEFLIQEIWDAIHQSRPCERWAASGYRRLRFYTSAEEPVLDLLVNETDACHVGDHFDARFRCPGISGILEPLLRREYERRKCG